METSIYQFWSEISENIQYGGSSVVKTDSQRSRFIAYRVSP